MTALTATLAAIVAVTNHAGRVACGEFGGIATDKVVIGARAYPLTIFPPHEILRLKRMAGFDLRTPKEKRLDRARDLELERIRLREAEGEIDRETANRLRAQLGPKRAPR